MSHIQKPYCSESHQNKYIVLRKALEQGSRIKFDVLENVYSPSLLDDREAYWIQQNMPPLNLQIPKFGGGFTINKKAKHITYQEIMER